MNLDPAMVITALITVTGAGITSYAGVKVALAEIRRDVAAQKDKLTENVKRIERLEEVYFRPSGDR